VSQQQQQQQQQQLCILKACQCIMRLWLCMFNRNDKQQSAAHSKTSMASSKTSTARVLLYHCVIVTCWDMAAAVPAAAGAIVVAYEQTLPARLAVGA
jgi:hypothetical protein